VFHPDNVNGVEECSEEETAEAGASCMSLAFGAAPKN